MEGNTNEQGLGSDLRVTPTPPPPPPPSPSPNPQSFPLTGNITVTTTWSGDQHGTMTIVFAFDGETMGTLMVAGNGSSSQTGSDWNFGVAIIYAGATVSEILESGNAQVFFAGKVSDNGNVNTYNGLQIAYFNDIAGGSPG